MGVLNLTLPPVGSLSEADARQSLLSYLNKMQEQLNMILGGISEDNLGNNLKERFAAMETVSEKAKVLAGMLDNKEIAETKTLYEMYQSLRDSIMATADSVSASFHTSIAQNYNSIMSSVQANYYAVQDNKTLQEVISSQVTQMADQIRMEFSNLATIDVDTVTDIALNFKTYIRFSADGVEIGKQGDNASPIVCRVKNDRLEFALQGTNVVLAYISNNKLYVVSAEIEDISIGNSTNGHLDINVESDGLYMNWR